MDSSIQPVNIKKMVITYEDGTELVVDSITEQVGQLVALLVKQSGITWAIKAKQKKRWWLSISNLFKI